MMDEIEVYRLLLSMGFSEDTFIESVVLVRRNSDIINVLPLGLRYDYRGFLLAKIYRGSRTYDIISKGLANKFTICLTQKPETFFYAIFRKDIIINTFNEAKCPRKLCDACIDTEIKSIEQGEDYLRVELKPVNITISQGYPKGFTRASAAIIEALVYYTKLPFVSDDEKRKYVERIKIMREIVYRSSKKDMYREMIDNIVDRAMRYIAYTGDVR
ncbi:hypothetical protein Igag_0276 [Ignisphaera aggregans DSM 17230]|uniref:DUF447 family protein n=1 Tax=Ignisphaera aggregans (strain DSM 17230 / JCM 13409 / AQ1.S1) TaxID=583356 RepID=E0SQQ0_IGNAA|nr:hypothetical protein Igag_0276 [Ignisphaera aggregans DSM 17230]